MMKIDIIYLGKQLKKGNEKALEKTIKHFTPLVYTLIYNVSKGFLSDADIEELSADVFFALWNNREKIIPEKLKGYICSIAKNKSKDKLKTLHISKSIDEQELVLFDELNVQENIENKEINKTLKDGVNSIEEPDREIVIRYYFYYQSLADISEIMNINNNTVKTKVKRAREKLKCYLVERGLNLEL